MEARRLAIESASIMASPGTRRGRTTQGQWTSIVLENLYECTSRDPDELEVWCYTDRLSDPYVERITRNVLDRYTASG